MPVTMVVALMPSLKETPMLLRAAEDFLHAVHTLSNPAVLSGSFSFPDVW
ncbi:hypothetical protein [Archangium lipolyticum]|nr:hypothetical protein [Archangium lipolyticum]